MDSDRGNWYLLTGILLGIGLGLLYAWVISPVGLENTHPHILRSDYKDVYRALIAVAYQATGDLPRAQARLDLLKEKDEAANILAAQAQQILAEGGDYQEAKALAALSSALLGDVQPPGSPTWTPIPTTSTLSPTTTPTITVSSTPNLSPTVSTTPGEENGTPTETSPPTETPTPLPTFTPTPTPISPFILENDESICDPALTTPLIQIYATNKKGEGVPGVEIIVTWGDNKRENFFTGLKPEFGYGYADFEMVPEVDYTVEFPNSGIQVRNVRSVECLDEEDEIYWGSWQIFVTQPD